MLNGMTWVKREGALLRFQAGTRGAWKQDRRRLGNKAEGGQWISAARLVLVADAPLRGSGSEAFTLYDPCVLRLKRAYGSGGLAPQEKGRRFVPVKKEVPADWMPAGRARRLRRMRGAAEMRDAGFSNAVSAGFAGFVAIFYGLFGNCLV